MAEPVWGLLQKSLVDNETIEQAIVRLILVHKQDEESHLGVGESLQSHKASEIIDHLAESIVTDKLANKQVTVEKMTLTDKLILQPTFDQVDYWYLSVTGIGADVFAYIGYITLRGGTVVDNKTVVAAANWDRIFRATTDKNPFLRCLVQTNDKTLADFIFGYGDSTPWSPSNLIAFSWSKTDSKLYAYTKATGFVAQSVEITGINVDLLHEYAIEVLALGSTINFYVDGVLKTTVSRVGFSIDSDIGPVFGVRNKVNGENPDVYFGSFYLYQNK